jgi:hypothetical protein
MSSIASKADTPVIHCRLRPGSDQSHGCLEMICADFPGANLENRNPKNAPEAGPRLLQPCLELKCECHLPMISQSTRPPSAAALGVMLDMTQVCDPVPVKPVPV